MKIQGPNKTNPIIKAGFTQGISKKEKSSRGTESEPVNVSQAARLWEEAHAPEEVNMQKVQVLRQAIDNGTFNVDPGKIADKILLEEN